MSKDILVTGAAGFIGFHLCKKLIEKGLKVIGIDNINSYYDQELKKNRLKILNNLNDKKNLNWVFIKKDLMDKEAMMNIFKSYEPNIVVNLAAQAGVRYSLENPKAYIDTNIVGFSNILECCRIFRVKNLLYASSSSVYGGNTKVPFSEIDPVNHPVSIYAATKRSNELLAHTYSHLYNIPSIGMRFFTVYGPWGRPDMAPMIFAESILQKKPIKIFNYGKMSRSFTFIDDVVETILKLIQKPAIPDEFFNSTKPNPSTSFCSNRIFNIGNEQPTDLEEFISLLEMGLGTKAIRKYLPMQQGDVQNTMSSNKAIKKWLGDIPNTSIEVGVKSFIKWYKDFYNY